MTYSFAKPVSSADALGPYFESYGVAHWFVAPTAVTVLAEVAQPLQTSILFPHFRPARLVALATTLILNLSTRYCTPTPRDEDIVFRQSGHCEYVTVVAFTEGGAL